MPPHLPARRKTSKRAIAALVLSVLLLLATLRQATRNVDYRGDIARGVGAWSVPLMLAIVVVALAVTGMRTARIHGKNGKGPAIAAIIIAGLAAASSILHIVALIVTSGQ